MKHARHLLLMVATLLCSIAVSAEGITDVSQLSNTKLYHVTQPYHSSGDTTSWVIIHEYDELRCSAEFNIFVTPSDDNQLFSFISNDGGVTRYLYHPVKQKFVNKDGSLDATPNDPVHFTSGAYDGTFVVYFDDSHYVNINGQPRMVIDRWSTADGGNSCAILPAGDFDPAEALARFDDVEEEYTIEFAAGANGWINGAEWYDEAQQIVGYASPLYRFQGKVETLRITVNRSAGNTKYFCLSELEFYDADGQKIALTADAITSNADHNALNSTPDGGGIPALLDGDTQTYFHSAWQNMPAGDHYLEVTLPNGGYDAFSFKMLSRAKSINPNNNTVVSQQHTFPGQMVMTTTVAPVVAELPEGVVNDLSAADPTKCYTVTTYGRGAWAVDSAGTRLSCTAAENLSIDAANPQQQFAFLTVNSEDYYLYSVSAEKFVAKDGSLVAGVTDALAFADASSIAENHVLVSFRDYADGYINIDDRVMQLVITSWNNLDDGNVVLIAEAGDFDAAKALSMLQAPVVPDTTVTSTIVTDLAAADPTKCYTIATTVRGAWAVDADGTRFSTTTVEGLDVDAADARQQFAVLSANGEDYYLYSVSAKKFVKRDRTLTVGTPDAIEFVDASSMGEGRVLVRFRDYANANINIGGDYQMTIDRWSTIDEGNAVLIAEAGDFDATEALAMLAAPEATELAALIAQVQELVTANAGNHAAEPALGQYSTVAYEGLIAAVNADSVSKASLEAAIAAFEAAKCLPVFTVDGVYSYAAGMSIYESTYDNGLHWKETDRTDETMLWAFDITDTIVGVADRVVVRNLATGNYFGNGRFIQVTETEEEIADDGLFLIYYEGIGDPICAYTNGAAGGGERWSANSVAAWKFTYAGTTYGINPLPVVPDTPDAPVVTDTVEATLPLEFESGANGWIEGTEWYDEEKGILGYTSPLYRFENKVETFYIVVKSSQAGEPFFCLSELGFYDADGTKIELTAEDVTSNADHNVLNPDTPDGGGIAALFDDDMKTYFHSAWQNIPEGAHHLKVTLPNGGYDAFSFRMISRGKEGAISQAKTFPAEMVITEAPRREALKDLLSEVPSTHSFPEVGYYYDDFGYLDDAYVEAWRLVYGNGSEEECEAMIGELSQAIERYWANEVVRMPEPGKVYHIISAFDGFYENQLVDKAITVNEEQNTLWWEDLDTDNLQQGFMFEPVLDENGEPVVESWTVNHGNDGTSTDERHYLYYMKHAATGLYVDYDDNGGFRLVEQPCIVRLNHPSYAHDGQFHILSQRVIEDDYYYFYYLHAGDHNDGVVGDSLGYYGGTLGVSSGIVNWYGWYSTASAWFIREVHELPYTMPVSEGEFRSGFIHFEATDVITLTADKECSFNGLALYQDYYYIGGDNIKISGNTATITLDRKVTYCAIVFDNNEGVSTITLNTVVEEEALPGDVNSDGYYTMSDVVMMVNAVLERAQANFNADVADMNGDGVITMGDVVKVLNMVLGDELALAPARNREAATAPAMSAGEFAVMGGGRMVLPVALNNSEAYSAFQLDVVLPAGVKLAEATLTGRAKAGHTVAWNTLSDGTTRIVSYAVDNAAFRDNEGALLNLVLETSDELSADAMLTIEDGLFTTASGAERRAADVDVMMRAETTCIDGAYAASLRSYGMEGAVELISGTDAVVNIYAATGKLMQQTAVKAGKNVVALPAGIYIINGNKVIVK